MEDGPHASALNGTPTEFLGLIDILNTRGFCAFDSSTFRALPPRSSALNSRPASPVHPYVSSLNESPQRSIVDIGRGSLALASVSGAYAEDLATLPVPVLGGSLFRVHRDPHCGMLLGPVPVPAQEELCRFWIERRTGVELDENRPLADALVSGYLLCRLLDIEPPARPPRVNMPLRIAERNIGQFLARAARRRLDKGSLFDIQDLLFRRNIPRVLRSVAALARLTDPEGFGAVAAELPGARMQWTQADEPDELWEGDELIRRLVGSFQQLSWRAKLSIAVAGTQGSGKSATIDTILGRPFMPGTHALAYMPADGEFCQEEIDRIQLVRRATAEAWPRHIVERGTPLASEDVCKMYVKIAGVAVQVVELPSMESHVVGIEENDAVLEATAGQNEAVARDLQGEEMDVVLVVERLDDFDDGRFMRQCRRLLRLYGENLWSRVQVVLTHGSTFPPDGLSFDEFVAQCSHSAQCCVRDVSGDRTISVPVVIIENSSSCPTDRSTGCPVLPNGVDFRSRVINSLELLLARHQGMEPLPPTGMKRWWEDYAVVMVVFLLLTRI